MKQPETAQATKRLQAWKAYVRQKATHELRDDFELDRHGVTLAVSLMRRIEELEAELRTLSATRK